MRSNANLYLKSEFLVLPKVKTLHANIFHSNRTDYIACNNHTLVGPRRCANATVKLPNGNEEKQWREWAVGRTKLSAETNAPGIGAGSCRAALRWRGRIAIRLADGMR
jgi:hypothetical protein